MSELRLAHGLRFEDLYDPAGLARIDGLFVDHLRASDEGLAGRLMAARAEPASLDAKAELALIIAAAAHVDDFLGELFGIKDELGALRKQHTELAPLYSVKRLFVQRRALKAHNEAAAAALDADAIRAELTPLIGGKFDELSFRDPRRHLAEERSRTTRASWTSPPSMRPGRPRRRPARRCIARACCSRRRARSIRCTWCIWNWRRGTASRR